MGCGPVATLDGYARDVPEICQELDLRDVIFVGHSVSAMIGVLAVAEQPQRFAGLVLLTPSPCYIDQNDYRGGFTRDDIGELLNSLDSNYLGWSASMAPVIMGNPDRPELGPEMTASFCRTDPSIAKAFARVTFLSDQRADLSRVSVPTLVLQSANDAIAPPEVGAYVTAQIPGNRLVTLDTTVHCPQLSAPEATAQAIAASWSPPPRLPPPRCSRDVTSATLSWLGFALRWHGMNREHPRRRDDSGAGLRPMPSPVNWCG